MLTTAHRAVTIMPAAGSGALVAVLVSASVAETAQTAIRAGALIDPATATVDANVIILVDGVRITAVGAEVDIPKKRKSSICQITTSFPASSTLILTSR